MLVKRVGIRTHWVCAYPLCSPPGYTNLLELFCDSHDSTGVDITYYIPPAQKVFGHFLNQKLESLFAHLEAERIESKKGEYMK